ncbi:MAG: sigma-70 family RNA polymerase sigma factor [Clostridia bacterium]|nr:sigma-70 family RNA polymerase sigma factor [Clostridia bacterium]
MGKHHGETAQYPDDTEIVALYLERDERAIVETDRKYGVLLYRLAYHILGDASDSEECRNDTYLGVWNAIPPQRPTSFRAFLTQIGRRIAINRYKEKKRKKRVPAGVTVSAEELENVLLGEEESEETREIGRAIDAFLRTLSRTDRYIFMERYYFFGTAERIAGDIGVSTSAVYKRLTVLKKRLKSHLEGRGIDV